MNKQRTASADAAQANTLNNGLIGNVIDSNLPYFTWDDLSQRSDNQKESANRTNHRAGSSANQPTTTGGKRGELTSGSSDDVLLSGASASPTGSVLESQCTKNPALNNNNHHHFNSNLSANYQNFHADRELEEEVELFENNQTELREQDDDEFEVDEDEDQLNDEILASYTRNGTLQSNNYLHNATLGQRLLLMDQSARSTATSMQPTHYAAQSAIVAADANRTLADDGSAGGITNQAFIGLHSCYGYPKCESINCGNCNKAHLTANLGDHINTSSSSWFSVSSQSRTICSLGCCAILTTCLFILLAIVSVVGISIYLSNATNQNKSNVLPLSGRFKVQSGDQFAEQLYNTSSREFQMKTTKYEAIVSNWISAKRKLVIHIERFFKRILLKSF